MKTYQQARVDKYMKIVKRIESLRHYELESVAKRLGMNALELSSFC